MPVAEKAPAKPIDWADEDDEEEAEYSESTDENGIKTIVELKTNEKGQKVRVTRKIKISTRKVRINKNVEARKKWKKFGDAVSGDQGTTTIGEEFDFVLGGPQQKEEQKEVPSAPSNAVCRICGKVGDHWTLKCPLKKSSDEKGEPEPEPEATTKSSKYVPPSKRAGAVASAGGDDGGRGRRDDFATVRVTNLSEDTKEPDLQELFRPFGPISRIYLAKDKDYNVSRGFAFVSFIHKEDAAKAIEKLSGYGYDHLILHLEWAKPSK